VILCLETSAAVSSVALSNGKCHWLRQAATENFQAEHILTLIDELLQEAGVKGADLDTLAVSIGPGRFTGLRIGVAVAQGLAFAWHKKIIAIDSLAILAQGVYRRYGDEKIAVMMDARQEEVYHQSFICNGGIMVSEGDLSLHSISTIMAYSSEWVGAGNGFTQYPLLAKKVNKWYISAADQLPVAEDMIVLAAKAYKEKKEMDPEHILPNYLRVEVVTTIK
jgi:tRNA threonylcarbamoyladenosine biosynthesis protein TsaB